MRANRSRRRTASPQTSFLEHSSTLLPGLRREQQLELASLPAYNAGPTEKPPSPDGSFLAGSNLFGRDLLDPATSTQTPHDGDDEEDDCNLFRNRKPQNGPAWKTGFHSTALAEKEMRAKALKAFQMIDKGRGVIEASEVRVALRKLGITSVAEEDILAVTDRSGDGCGDLDFPGVLQVVTKCLVRQESPDDTTLSTFVALGGNANRTGGISVAKLKNLIYELGIPLNIDRLVKQMDSDCAASLDFSEFSALLGED